MSTPSRPAGPALLVIGAALGAILPSWAKLPMLLYAPVERALRWAPIGAPGGPPVEITYYGTYLWAAIGAAIGALLGLAWDRRARAPHPLLAAWTLTALALAAAYQTWNVWP